jgi:lipase chaperone LimK
LISLVQRGFKRRQQQGTIQLLNSLPRKGLTEESQKVEKVRLYAQQAAQRLDSPDAKRVSLRVELTFIGGATFLNPQHQILIVIS